MNKKKVSKKASKPTPKPIPKPTPQPQEEEFDEAHEIEEVKPVRISLHMISQRHLPTQATQWKQEQILEGLNEITHLRLDRENISHIDTLELLGPSVSHVYLQMNRIETIEGLDTLVNLRFLTLANNKIKRVEGLAHLTKLGLLDLSDNDIETIDIDEFPQSLVILNLKDNPCTNLPDHRGRMIQDLAKLQQLNLVEVSKQERIEAGYTVSSSDEEGEDEEEEEEEEGVEEIGSGDHEQVDIVGVMSRIRHRVKERMEESHQEHLVRMAALTELKEKYSIGQTPREDLEKQ